jgi:hypothetical protein
MKLKTLVLVLIFCFIEIQIWAQTIEIGVTYTSSNANFYKNIPGLNIGFAYHLKNQYFFSGITTSFKNNSFSEISSNLSAGRGYIMRKVDGNILANSLKLGIVQKLKNSKYICISAGGYACLNYFKFDDNIHYFNYESGIIGYDHFSSRDDFEKNKVGFGCLIDLELKQVIFDNTSLFSRFNSEIIYYDGNIEGLSFINPSIASVCFMLGIKINLMKSNACP